MTRKGGVLVPATVPFWLKPISTFGLFSLTMFIERSPGFTLPSILQPVSYDFALISESYYTNKYRIFYY